MSLQSGAKPGQHAEEQGNEPDCELVWAGTFSITPLSSPAESEWQYIHRRLRELGFDSTRDTEMVYGYDDRGKRFFQAFSGEGLRYSDPRCGAPPEG
jgi:hypothetical protein